MAVRPDDLPAATTVNPATALIVDDGNSVRKATPLGVVDAAIPLATQAEAETGEDNAKRVTPLRVKQAIDALGTSAEALASTDPGGGIDLVSRVAYPVFTRTALKGLPTDRYQVALLNEAGRQGEFVWSGDNLSAEVTSDPEEGIYIAPSSDATGANGAWIRDTTNGLPITATGAVPEDMVADYHDELMAAFKLSATYGVPLVGGGSFRIDDSLVLDETYSGLSSTGHLKINFYGSHTSNKAAILIPQVGDNYGGNVAPASGVTFDHLEADGSNATSTNFTTGLAVFGGENNKFGTVITHGFLKSGCLVASIAGSRTDCHIAHLESYANTNGTVGQGVAVASKNIYDSITFGRIITHTNGSFGFDWSDGSVTADYVESYGNNTGGATGGGGKWAGGDDQKIRIGRLYLHDNLSTGAFSNTEGFTLFEVDHLECVANKGAGIQFNFAGEVRIGSAFLRGNDGRGLEQSTGSILIGKAVVDGNCVISGNAGISCAGGDIAIAKLVSKNHATACGFITSTLGQVWVGAATSEDDLNGCIRYVPSAPSKNLTVGPVTISYDGVSGDCFGVFLNANAQFPKIGTIVASGGAGKVGGTGVNVNAFESGNSAVATTLGTVARKIEVFDKDGASLGFVPVYDAIT